MREGVDSSADGPGSSSSTGRCLDQSRVELDLRACRSTTEELEVQRQIGAIQDSAPGQVHCSRDVDLHKPAHGDRGAAARVRPAAPAGLLVLLPERGGLLPGGGLVPGAVGAGTAERRLGAGA